jgi:uncharacterized coiled-coil protein SlyX
MNFPIYKIKIDMDDITTGLTAVSLVDCPAVERDFLLFDKQEMLFKADEDKQIISGIALLADTPIYRRNQNGEFYVVFEKDTIRQLVEKYSKQGLFNSVNLMHQSDSFVNNVYLIESLIIDKERGICPTEFKDCPDGSWYVSYYVDNKELWNEIKNGEWFNGFSVEITANLEMNKNTNKNEFDMNKMLKLAKMLLKMAEIKTDKAVLIIQGDLEVGKPALVDVEGELLPAEDGTYTTEEGATITIVEGVIAEIVEAEAPAEEPVEEPNAEVEELKKKIEELEATIAEKDATIAELEGKIAEQEEKLKMSVETPLKKKSKMENKENKALKYFQ